MRVFFQQYWRGFLQNMLNFTMSWKNGTEPNAIDPMSVSAAEDNEETEEIKVRSQWCYLEAAEEVTTEHKYYNGRHRHPLTPNNTFSAYLFIISCNNAVRFCFTMISFGMITTAGEIL